MRIRITDVDYVLRDAGYGDHPLRYFGVSVGDEFDTTYHNDYGYLVEKDGEELFIRNREAEIIYE